MPEVSNERITCKKCGRTRRTAEYFVLKDGKYCEMCKDCLCMYIDNQKPETFLWILEMFDVPYIEKNWIDLYNKEYKKDPSKIGPRSIIGRYLRTMKMTQYRDYTYADTDKLNFKEQLAIGKSLKEDLQKRLDIGEISQAEFNTLTTPVQEPQFIPNFSQENEDKITEQLSEEDYQYLLLKWGELYRPSQWVRLEELYRKYESEYELNADREDALKKICKVSLKIDESLDIGDIAAVDKLQRTYDNLRKSAKFTEVQNKESTTRELDSIGELVAFVEQKGGAIPLFKDNPVADYAEDKIDFCMRDIQNYINNLVREELGLGDLIETYIENLQNNKIDTVEDILHQDFGKEETLTAEDVEEFSEFQAEEIEKEAQALLAEFGDA